MLSSSEDNAEAHQVASVASAIFRNKSFGCAFFESSQIHILEDLHDYEEATIIEQGTPIVHAYTEVMIVICEANVTELLWPPGVPVAIVDKIKATHQGVSFKFRPSMDFRIDRGMALLAKFHEDKSTAAIEHSTLSVCLYLSSMIINIRFNVQQRFTSPWWRAVIQTI